MLQSKKRERFFFSEETKKLSGRILVLKVMKKKSTDEGKTEQTEIKTAQKDGKKI